MKTLHLGKFCGMFWLLFALANLHPIHIHPYRMYFQDLLVVASLILLLSMFIRRHSLSFNVPWVIVIPAIILLILASQSVDPSYATSSDLVIPTCYLLLFILSLVIGSSLVVDQSKLQQFCRLAVLALLTCCFLSVAMQITQLLAWDWRPLVMYMPLSKQLARPFANVAQPNQLALLYCMSLATLYWWQQSRRVSAYFILALALWIIAGLVMTQSRIAWIILPLMALLIGWQERRNKAYLACLVVLLVGYFAMLSQLDVLATYLGHSGALAERLEGRSERKILWLQAIRMALDHPWLGVGWAGFGPAQVAIAADFTPSIYSEHAHNFVLNLAAEIGIPATLLICAALAYWCLAVFPKLWGSIEVRFMGLCLLAVAVHSMVEFPLWYAYILLPVGLMMGILHQMRWPARGFSVPAWGTYLVFLFACLAMCWITYDYWRVVGAFRAYQTKMSGYKINETYLRQPDWTLFPQFYRYFDLLEFKPRAGMSDQQIADFAFWTRRFGFEHNLNTLAEIYVLNGKIPQARRTMLTLYSLHPWRYAEYYDYWQGRARQEPAFAEALQGLPARDAGNK